MMKQQRATIQVAVQSRAQHGSSWYWLGLVLAMALALVLLSITTANAATPRINRDGNQRSATLEAGIPDQMAGAVDRPMVASGTPPVTMTAALTVTVTATSTATPQATPVAEAVTDDAFTAWNSRAPVTRQENYPVRLRIPAIGVDAYVEQMGEQADGSMATPTDPDNVAWYSYGAIPGENGNMVMAGHLDRIGGSPAVFWDLSQLDAGDRVVVQDGAGATYHYVVTEQTSYPYNEAPLSEIFGFDLVSRLNLITCRGDWDRSRQTYTERLVVYTELVKIVES